jgi:hypothetical protein
MDQQINYLEEATEPLPNLSKNKINASYSPIELMDKQSLCFHKIHAHRINKEFRLLFMTLAPKAIILNH